MALKVAELFATLGIDGRDMDRTLDRSMRDARRSVARGMSDAAKAGGDELVDGLESGAEDSIDAVVKVLKGSESEMDRAGQRVGEAFADGLDDGVRQVEGAVDAEMLGGSPAEFRREGDQLGSALADGIESGVRSTSANVDPSALGASPGEFRREGDKLGGALADGIEDGVDTGGSGAVGGFLDGLPIAVGGAATMAGGAIAAALVIGMEEALSSEATSKRLGASLNLDISGQADVDQTITNLRNAGTEAGIAAEAVEAVYSSLEDSRDSQQALEELTTQAIGFSSTFGTDVTTAVELARVLISEGLAKDGTEAFDLLSQAMADTPLYNRDELRSAIDEYAKYFAGIGLDGPKTMAILAASAESGSYALDATGDSVKEFGLIMRDMPDAAGGALADMGLDVEDLQAKIAEGGPAAQEAFAEIISAIQGIEDPLERGLAAAAVLGTPFENVATDIDGVDAALQALSSQGMTDFEGASQRNVEAMDTLQAKVDGYVSSPQQIVGQAGAGMALIIGGIFDGEIREEWSAGWDQLNMLSTAGVDGTIMDLLRIPGRVGELPGMIADAGRGMWESITSSVVAAVTWSNATLDNVISFVAGMPGRIAGVAAGMWDGIKDAFRDMLVGIANGWNSLSFPSFTIPSIETPFGTIGGGRTPRIDLPDISIPAFHTGGMVPGTPGQEILAALMPGEMVLTQDQQASINAALNADLSSAMLGSGSAAAAAGGSSVPMAEVGILANRVAALTREVARKGDNITIAGVSDPMRAVRHLGREKRARAWARGVG